MVAGGWATLLIFYRVFSRPAGHGYPVGIQWGFFLAFVASGALTYAGWRMRATSPPEPPLRTRAHARRAPLVEDITVLAPSEDITVVAPAPARPERAAPVPARPAPKRPRFPPKPSEQLSFEDQPPSGEQPYHSPDDAP
jgi:hypothetical protein